jgi:protein O-mannosyl-transferase
MTVNATSEYIKRPEAVSPEPRWTSHVAICVALLVGTLGLYAPVRHFNFVYFDDKEYVTENPHLDAGLTARNVLWAFTHAYAGNWHPLTWVSHMVDRAIWGLNPAGHHLTNVAIHSLNAVLLYLVLARMTGYQWRSALVAGLFAWHPLHVESVAWVSERKDVLCTLFSLLTVGAYLQYVRQPKWQRYAVVMLCFALALLSKPMAVTLPFILLLLDYWPLNRLQGTTRLSLFSSLRSPVWEKLPLVLLALGSSTVTFLVQQAGGALWSVQQLSVGQRMANSAMSYVAYLGKAIWPVDLAVFYPYRVNVPLGELLAAILLLLGVTFLSLYFARRLPFLAVGWFWFIVQLVPVIGLVQTGGQAMADRYTYLPLTGIFIIAVWGACSAFIWSSPARIALVVIAAILLAAFLICTAHQLSFWKDNSTLFRRAIAVTSENAFAHLNLAESLRDEGDLAGAASHQMEALRINPGYREAHHNLGVVLLLQGKVDAAIAQFGEALRLYPDYPIAHNNLGDALMRKGKIESAVYHFQEALRARPDLAEAQNNLAWIRATQTDPAFRNADEALSLACRAVESTGRRNASMLDTLAAALAEKGRFAEAATIAEEARLLALSQSQPQVAAAIAGHVELFRRGQPYRSVR